MSPALRRMAGRHGFITVMSGSSERLGVVVVVTWPCVTLLGSGGTWNEVAGSARALSVVCTRSMVWIIGYITRQCESLTVRMCNIIRLCKLAD